MTARKRQASEEGVGALGLGCGHLDRFHRALISVVFSGNLAGFRPPTTHVSVLGVVQTRMPLLLRTFTAEWPV
jgi:hypothetical protein